MSGADRRAKLIIEAALFAAGRPLTVEELRRITGLKKKSVEVFVEALSREYSARETSLEVGRFGDKCFMRLKPEYAQEVSQLAPREVPPGALKTLALIAYHQPVPQSMLVKLLGCRVYDHVKQLKEMGLISWEPYGNSKLLKTTERFADYFGIERGNKDAIREYLMRKLKINKEGRVETGGGPEDSSGVEGQ
ncbi:SMC-Scp complex subunit ScpB [Thermoplasmatales archaeon ex4484_36]|nr:MAG: SMC-Scp complex subunit ScpB [Thermoplasmatales archaeon ex4484_36]